MKTIKTLAVLAAVIAGSSVYANPYVTGTINFGGISEITLNAATFPAVTAVNFNSPGLAFVSSSGVSAGSFAPLFGSFASFSNFTIGTPKTGLWTDGLWSFDLATSANTSPDNTFLNIKGSGTIHAPGFANTPGSFTLSASRTGGPGQITFSFASSTSANGVPDGGATAMLIGAGILGLGVLRRKLA